MNKNDAAILQGCRRRCSRVEDCFCKQPFPNSSNMTYEAVANSIRKMHARSYRAAKVPADPSTTDIFINKWFKSTHWAEKTAEVVTLIRRTIRCVNDPKIKKGQQRASFKKRQGEFNF